MAGADASWQDEGKKEAPERQEERTEDKKDKDDKKEERRDSRGGVMCDVSCVRDVQLRSTSK